MAHLIGAMMDGPHPQTTKQEIKIEALFLDNETMNRGKKKRKHVSPLPESD
jgi:hypothetical protein